MGVNQFWDRESLLDPSRPRRRRRDSVAHGDDDRFRALIDPEDELQAMHEPLMTHTRFDGTRARFDGGFGICSDNSDSGESDVSSLPQTPPHRGPPQTPPHRGPPPPPQSTAPLSAPPSSVSELCVRAGSSIDEPSEGGQCRDVLCGNCHRMGHCAAECPLPAPCFKCKQLGHWARDCPSRHLHGPCFTCGELGHVARHCPSNPHGTPPTTTAVAAETRWVLCRPRLKHFCMSCSMHFPTLTKGTAGMQRHKRRDGSAQWCDGSGKRPRLSVFV